MSTWTAGTPYCRRWGQLMRTTTIVRCDAPRILLFNSVTARLRVVSQLFAIEMMTKKTEGVEVQ